jgi:type IV pilus assembly protein PilW
MNAPNRVLRPGQRGFSLVELMVGVAVALVAVVVIMQVFQLSEGRRRTTTGGDDAQASGLIASSMLQRDLRQAGQGIVHANLLACALTLPSGRVINNLTGIVVNDPDIPAGDANTDTLRVAYGSGSGSPEGTRVLAQPSGNVYSVAAARAFVQNDNVIATPEIRPLACTALLTTVSAVPVGNNVSTTAAAVGMANGVLHNLGQPATTRVYRVTGGLLTVCDYAAQNCTNAAAANWTPIAEGIVSLRAQYGQDTNLTMDGTIEEFNQTTPTTVCGWYRRPAVRLVLVARSGQLEQQNVTAVAPNWAGSAGAPVVLTALGNWQRYRYKTFETTVALRNVAWQGVITGC